MLRGKPLNTNARQFSNPLHLMFGATAPVDPSDWEYTIERDIVKHSTLLGFVLQAPMGRKIAITAEEVGGLLQTGFGVVGLTLPTEGKISIPFTKNVITFEEVQSLGSYISSGVMKNLQEVDDWAEAGFPAQK